MTPPVPPPLLADRYVLGPAVGRGRSTVFRARDRRLQRDVAVKQVDIAACEPLGPARGVTLRARALREARALARVSSPQAVVVFDVVEEHGSLWLVMELVDAPSLRGLVERHGPLDDRRAALIGLDVLAALAAAHATGVVHRDVKPSNVLVPRGGPAKLSDFGVASVRDEEQLTAPGMVVGSPSYMAPEQACGRPAGPAADLWALGAMLYFAVEGRAPFPGGSPVAAATAVVHGSPRPQQRPGPLSPLIRHLLAKDPRHRPGMATVRRELAVPAYRPAIPDRGPVPRADAPAGAAVAGERASDGTQAVDMRAVLASDERALAASDRPGSRRDLHAAPPAPGGRRPRRPPATTTARRRPREVVAAAAATVAVALGAGALASSSMEDAPTVSPATAGSPTTAPAPATEQAPATEGPPTTKAVPDTEGSPIAQQVVPTEEVPTTEQVPTTVATPTAEAVSTTVTTSGADETGPVTAAGTPTTVAPPPSTTVPDSTTTTTTGDDGGDPDDGEQVAPGGSGGPEEDPLEPEGDGEQAPGDDEGGVDGGDGSEDPDPGDTGDVDGLVPEPDGTGTPGQDIEDDDPVDDEADGSDGGDGGEVDGEIEEEIDGEATV